MISNIEAGILLFSVLREVLFPNFYFKRAEKFKGYSFSHLLEIVGLSFLIVILIISKKCFI